MLCDMDWGTERALAQQVLLFFCLYLLFLELHVTCNQCNPHPCLQGTSAARYQRESDMMLPSTHHWLRLHTYSVYCTVHYKV